MTADSSLDSEEEDVDEQRSRSPAGNGSRLGDSSRNGSSSAGAAAAGVGALREGGYRHSAAESHLRNGVAAGSLSDDEADTLPPAYHDADEGFHDGYGAPSLTELYAPLNRYDDAAWSFDAIGQSRNAQDSDDAASDAASDAPNLGSMGADDLDDRMLEDFGDDMGTRPGVSTPTDGISVEQGNDDVTEIRLRAD